MSPDQEIDDELYRGGDAYDEMMGRGPRGGTVATEDGAEGHSGSASDAAPRNAPDPSKRFTPDQQAVVDLAKDAKQRGGVSAENADTLVKWGKEAGFGDGARGPENHGGASGDHIHVGPVNHIPVLPAPNPAVVGGILGLGGALYYLWPILVL
jgi:hypothetical protein